jgi:nucleoside-triphosphatase THEP1
MPKHIAILTGPFGSGKTTACRQLADLAQQRGLDCAGIVCPARFDGTDKVGIDLLNLRTGECHPLAEADNQPSELRTTLYRFDAEVMAWGATSLDMACPCDVLIVDEIGPLELERGQGWVNALDVLREGQFDLAVVVVRPSLVDAFRTAVGDVTMSLFTLPFSQSDDCRLDDILSLMERVAENTRVGCSRDQKNVTFPHSSP